jgi:hypothetical protein
MTLLFSSILGYCSDKADRDDNEYSVNTVQLSDELVKIYKVQYNPNLVTVTIYIITQV